MRMKKISPVASKLFAATMVLAPVNAANAQVIYNPIDACPVNNYAALGFIEGGYYGVQHYGRAALPASVQAPSHFTRAQASAYMCAANVAFDCVKISTDVNLEVGSLRYMTKSQVANNSREICNVTHANWIMRATAR